MDYIDLIIEANKLVEKFPNEFHIWKDGSTDRETAESDGWEKAWDHWTTASEWWLAAHDRDPKNVRSMIGVSKFGRQLIAYSDQLKRPRRTAIK